MKLCKEICYEELLRYKHKIKIYQLNCRADSGPAIGDSQLTSMWVRGELLNCNRDTVITLFTATTTLGIEIVGASLVIILLLQVPCSRTERGYLQLRMRSPHRMYYKVGLI